MSQSSKDVMDALKESASTTRSEHQAQMSSSEPSPGQVLKESLIETYSGVPKSLEAEALQSKSICIVSRQYDKEMYTTKRNNNIRQFNSRFIFIDL